MVVHELPNTSTSFNLIAGRQMAERRTVAVHLASRAKTEELQALLVAAGVDVLAVRTADELRHHATTRTLDCIVLHQELSGFLTGMEIVERLRKENVESVAVLVGDLTGEQVAREAEIRIQFALPMASSNQAICQAVCSGLFIAGAYTVTISPKARQLAADCGCFRPMPQLVMKAMSQVGSTTGDVKELAHDLAADPVITAELMRIINSASLGLRYKIKRVYDLVNYLGFRRTVAMIITISQQHERAEIAKRIPDWVDQWFYSRSLLLASTGFAVADQYVPGGSDTAHVLGLTQDIGILALVYEYGSEYLKLLERCRKVGQLQLHQSEKHSFAVNHAEVGAALLQKWGVPSAIVRQVLTHHDPDHTNTTDMEARLTQVMQFSEAFVDLKDAPSPMRHQRLARVADQFHGLSSDQCRVCLERAVAKTMEFQDLFDLPAPPEDELRAFAAKVAAEPPEEWPEELPDNFEPPEPVVNFPREDVGLALNTHAKLLVIDQKPIVDEIQRMVSEHHLDVITESLSRVTDNLLRQVVGVMCEVHLSGQGGVEFVRTSREAGFAGPMILMSVDRSRDTIVQAAKAGATTFLPKPLQLGGVLQALRRENLIE